MGKREPEFLKRVKTTQEKPKTVNKPETIFATPGEEELFAAEAQKAMYGSRRDEEKDISL